MDNYNPWDIKSDDGNDNDDENHSNDDANNNINDEDLDEYELEERLKRAEEENEKRLLIARVKKKLDDIMSIDPFIRNKKSILLKAFVVWSKVLPLNQKCNELAHQLQERLSVVESLRDSYLRDVVAVKYYLNKIHEYKQAQDQQIKSEGLPDMYDLHAIPSTSLRHIIDKAKQGSDMTSDSLQEALIMSGLITPGSGKEIQVWDKSKMFKKQMKINHGPSYKLPKTGGGTINLAAPGKHKVFVRYCNTCIGVMSFVHEWNQSIEEGLKRNVENLSYEANILKLKNSIINLNKIVEDQEKELVEVKKKHYTLQKSGKWMEDWKNSLEIKETGVDFMKEELSRWKNCAGMADAEKETRVNETVLRFNDKIAKLQYQLIESNREIDRQVSINDKERQAQVEAFKKLSASESIIKDRDQELKSTKATLEDKISEIKKLNLKAISLQRDEANATKKQMETQSAFDDYKIEMNTANDDLRGQIMELEKSVTNKDETIKKLNDLVRELKKQVSNKSKTIEDYIERDKKAEEDRVTHELAVAQALARKPKHSLKIIALVIICARKITKAVTAVRDQDDYSLMGALGRRDQFNKELVKRNHLKKLNFEAEEEIKRLSEAFKNECRTTQNLTDQNNKLIKQIEKLEKSVEKFTTLVKEHEKNYKELDEQYDRKEQQYLDSDRDNRNLKSFISKFSVLTQMQRNLATKVIVGVNQARNILSMIEISNKETEDKPAASETEITVRTGVSASFVNTSTKTAEVVLVPPSPASLRLIKFKNFCHEFFDMVKKEGTSERRSTLIPFNVQIYCPPLPDNPKKVFLNDLKLVSNYKEDLTFIEELNSKLVSEAQYLRALVTTLKEKNQDLIFAISEKERIDREQQEKLEKAKKKLRTASRLLSLNGLSLKKNKEDKPKRENSILKKISQKNAALKEHEDLLNKTTKDEKASKAARRATKLERKQSKIRKDSLLESTAGMLPSQIIASKKNSDELTAIEEDESFTEQNNAAIVLQRKVRKSLSSRRSSSVPVDNQLPIDTNPITPTTDIVKIGDSEEEHKAAIVLQQRMRQSISRKKSLSVKQNIDVLQEQVSDGEEVTDLDANLANSIKAVEESLGVSNSQLRIVGTNEEHAAATVLQRRLSMKRATPASKVDESLPRAESPILDQTDPDKLQLNKPSDLSIKESSQSPPKNNAITSLKSINPNATKLNEEQKGQANLLKFMFGSKVPVPVDVESSSESDDDLDDDFDEDGDFDDQAAWNSMVEKLKKAEDESERLGSELMSSMDSETKLKKDIEQLRQSIDGLEALRNELQNRNKEHEDYLEKLLKDYEISMNENANLREAVEDSYRAHIAEVGKIESDRIRKSIKDEEDRRKKLRNRGTHISCSVCAIRAIVTDNDGHWKKDPESNNRESYDPHSSCFDDNLDTVERGDKVISAYAKDINEYPINKYLSDTSISRSSCKEAFTESPKYDDIGKFLTASGNTASQFVERPRPYSANHSLSRKVKTLNNISNDNPVIHRSNSANTNLIKDDTKVISVSKPVTNIDKRNNTDIDEMPNTKFRTIKQFPTRGYTGGPVKSQVSNASAFLQNEMLLKLEEQLIKKQIQKPSTSINDNI